VVVFDDGLCIGSDETALPKRLFRTRLALGMQLGQ
jgi:hypothetical protein